MIGHFSFQRFDAVTTIASPLIAVASGVAQGIPVIFSMVVLTDMTFMLNLVAWLGPIRTTNIGTYGRWKNIRFTCENAAGNWNTFACARQIAASIYLGHTADVQ